MVDLPEALGPSRASTSPAATENATSRLSLLSRSWMRVEHGGSLRAERSRLKTMTTRLTRTRIRLSAIASSVMLELWLM